jgi:hypothetical protein
MGEFEMRMLSRWAFMLVSSQGKEKLVVLSRSGPLCSKDQCKQADSAKLIGLDFDYFPQVSNSRLLHSL